MIRNLFILLTIIISGLITAQDDSEAIVVMELFTSQGCNSCPPADKLLDTIKEKYEDNNVFVLSYHVDYWNRLGWRDPFSDEAFSDYQRDYAQQFNSRSIYTPQLVVNGSEHFTGSNGPKALTAIHKYSKFKTTNTIKINDLKKEDDQIKIEYNVEGSAFDQVTFALIVSERTTNISSGENRNRTLKNTNIVVNRLVVYKESTAVTLSIPDWIDQKDELAIIVYAQDKKLKTTGATKIHI
ncbi:thioredoxin family protein [uncultured Aquimarina sp.]|uniref:DUF1223 domain-containing protein n=1 Tax=uncultured Aquimarina sp. TaxID=575652 RepID=UPI002634F883|nr:DUF1223 domain-containing protein [uncultured Aquimarina sp.]